MKNVLRAIGGFFAKIGRWIANTAWIQPLLIVGGIFGIIFSIPYIKKGIDGLVAANQTDDKIEYYKSRAISLDNAEDHNSDFDKLLTWLEEGNETEIKNKYGEKFFLSFVTEDCSYCKECVAGFESLDSNFHEWELDKDNAPKFNLVSVMVDTTNDDGKYLAKYVFEEHQELFDEIVGEFSEYEDYPLLKNVTNDQKSSLKSSIEKLQNAIDDNGEGLETPTTFMIDLTATGDAAEVNVHGVTAIFFNYTDLLTTAGYNEQTAYYKGKFLADCWSYDNLFDKNKDKE